MAEAFVLETLRTVSRVPMFSDAGPLFCDPDGVVVDRDAFGATGAILRVAS